MPPMGMMMMPPMQPMHTMPPAVVAPGIAKLGNISGFLAAKKAQEEAVVVDLAAKEAAKEQVCERGRASSKKAAWVRLREGVL